MLAATCVSGNVDARQVAINTRAILELAGRPDIEVALGRETPLVRALETTPGDPWTAGAGARRAAPADTAAVDASRGRPHRRRGAPTAGRDHPRHARPADQPRDRRPARACPAPPAAWLHADGRRVRRVRQHDPDDRVEHPLRSGGGQDRPSRLGRGPPGRPVDPAAAGARPRRHRAGPDPARRRRPAGAAGRQHARRLDRAGARRGPDARHPVRGRQPGRPLRGRRAALLHGVPRDVRRVLRGVHPRPAGRRRRAGPRPRHDRGAVRRRRDARAS